MRKRSGNFAQRFHVIRLRWQHRNRRRASRYSKSRWRSIASARQSWCWPDKLAAQRRTQETCLTPGKQPLARLGGLRSWSIGTRESHGPIAFPAPAGPSAKSSFLG